MDNKTGHAELAEACTGFFNADHWSVCLNYFYKNGSCLWQLLRKQRNSKPN